MNGGWVVGDGPTVRGFELAGFRGVVAETGAAVRAAVERAHAERARLVVVGEAAALLAPEVLATPHGPLRTLVIAVPSLVEGRASTAGEHVQRVVRRALGLPEGRVP